MAKFGRRLFIRGAALGAVAATGAPYAFPPIQHETWSFYTGKETFHLISYVHDYIDKQVIKDLNPETEFPEQVDAIFMEDASDYLNSQFDPLWQKISQGELDRVPLLGPTSKYCRESGIPLFLGDLNPRQDGPLIERTNQSVQVMETALGSLAAVRAIRNPEITRRNFIQAALGLIIAGWGVSESVLLFLNREGGRKNLQETHTQIQRDIEATLVDRAHPEKVHILMRNALWAKKLYFLADELKARGIEHPKLGITAGFSHRYLDYFLRHKRDIDTVISMYGDRISDFTSSKAYIYGILELNIGKGNFTKELLEVPQLRKLYLEREGNSTETKG